MTVLVVYVSYILFMRHIVRYFGDNPNGDQVVMMYYGFIGEVVFAYVVMS